MSIKVDMDTVISVVIPEYRGEKMVSELINRLKVSLSSVSECFEIILVNDCSPDHTWEVVQSESAKESRVKGINFSRNFGQPYAIAAGLHNCSGEWVVVMDCDLQDRPEEIPGLYKKAQEGWDIVQARRENKQFGTLKKLLSAAFNKVLSWMSGMDTDKSIGNFGIYNKKVITAYNSIGEYSRGFQPLINYLGFKKTSIPVVHAARAQGNSSYTLRKLLSLSFNIILANSNKPLKVSVSVGFIMSTISFMLAIYQLIAHWIGLIEVSGYTSTIFSIWFVGGLILSVLGVMGLYIGRIFDQVKGRPMYVIRERVNV